MYTSPPPVDNRLSITYNNRIDKETATEPTLIVLVSVGLFFLLFLIEEKKKITWQDKGVR